jgi:hypothetical protein
MSAPPWHDAWFWNTSGSIWIGWIYPMARTGFADYAKNHCDRMTLSRKPLYASLSHRLPSLREKKPRQQTLPQEYPQTYQTIRQSLLRSKLSDSFLQLLRQ